MLELPFQTLLQGAFFKKPLENPQKLPSNTPLYFGKAFEDSQETFPEKFLVSEFEAEASTDNAHQKSTVKTVLFIFTL